MTAPRWIPWLAALVAFSAAIALGNWQTRRAAERDAIQASLDGARASNARVIASAGDVAAIESQLPRRVTVRGQFVEASTIYLGNRIVDGIAGFQIVTPLRIGSGTPLILVDRGWTPRDPRVANPAPAPQGTVVIEGLAVERLRRVLELGSAASSTPRLWANLDYSRFESEVGSAVARFVVEQETEVPDGLKRVRTRIDSGADRNRGYALQWYSLAALIVALSLFYGLRKRRPANSIDGH